MYGLILKFSSLCQSVCDLDLILIQLLASGLSIGLGARRVSFIVDKSPQYGRLLL